MTYIVMAYIVMACVVMTYVLWPTQIWPKTHLYANLYLMSARMCACPHTSLHTCLRALRSVAAAELAPDVRALEIGLP